MPREIRDMIYKRCLLYDGEIIPFPREYERQVYPNGFGIEPLGPKMRREKNASNAFFGYPIVKREARQTENKPCVALLGVNSTIRDEAATILFGMNTWRVSAKSYVQDDRYRLWKTYARYFRHVITSFYALDVYETAQLNFSEEFDDHVNAMDYANHHEKRLRSLTDGFTARRDILHQMNLKSLAIDFFRLSCPMRCCRQEAIHSCLVCLGLNGPWFKLKDEQGREMKSGLKTDVKVLGLMDEKDKDLLHKVLGVKVD